MYFRELFLMHNGVCCFFKKVLLSLCFVTGAGYAAPYQWVGDEVAKCHSSPNELLDQSVALDIDELNIRDLTLEEQKMIANTLSIKRGAYPASVVRYTCLGKNKNDNRLKQLNLNGEVKIGSSKKRGLYIDAAELGDEEDQRKVLTKGYWWQVDEGKLRAGEGQATSTQSRRWLVEVVDINENRFRYFTRHRLADRRMLVVTEVIKEAKRLRYGHYYYINGRLSGKELWLLGK